VNEETSLFQRIALIGLGLQGSSIARVAKREKLTDQIAGCARTKSTRDKALELGFVDSVHENPADAVSDADVVFLCTHIGSYGAIAEAIAPALKKGAIVTDVGSVKRAVIRDVAPRLPDGVHFVPGHPVAGTEHSGPESGFADLFVSRHCVLTPQPDCDPDAVEKIRQFWQHAGMEVEIMDADHHDRVLAVTSHLPHLIAYTIVGTVSDLEEQLEREAADDRTSIKTNEVARYSAGGFRDFTRIAASDPEMWRDVFLNNRDAVLEMLGRFSEDLAALQRAIRWGEAETLESLFRRTREFRRGIIEMRQAGTFSTTEPNEKE
jgi:cyclohexadieny/prephenate dehydrogenase